MPSMSSIKWVDRCDSCLAVRSNITLRHWPSNGTILATWQDDLKQHASRWHAFWKTKLNFNPKTIPIPHPMPTDTASGGCSMYVYSTTVLRSRLYTHMCSGHTVGTMTDTPKARLECYTQWRMTVKRSWAALVYSPIYMLSWYKSFRNISSLLSSNT